MVNKEVKCGNKRPGIIIVVDARALIFWSSCNNSFLLCYVTTPKRLSLNNNNRPILSETRIFQVEYICPQQIHAASAQNSCRDTKNSTMAPRQAPRVPPAKRRKTTTQVEELKFDPEARNEWLTGFRKRKQQRIKHAQEQSAKIEKEEKVKARKEVCVVAHSTLAAFARC